MLCVVYWGGEKILLSWNKMSKKWSVVNTFRIRCMWKHDWAFLVGCLLHFNCDLEMFERWKNTSSNVYLEVWIDWEMWKDQKVGGVIQFKNNMRNDFVHPIWWTLSKILPYKYNNSFSFDDIRFVIFDHSVKLNAGTTVTAADQLDATPDQVSTWSAVHKRWWQWLILSSAASMAAHLKRIHEF